ncbi:MAG: hypothetical protein QOI09_1640, partial [Chloroflexota bacterium]|nr:hypothetical protein [Chloroflexota bacterium]
MDLIVRCRLVTRILLLAIAWTVAVVAAIALVFAGSTETHLTGSGFSPGFVGLALAVATDASVGAVLALRRPGNVVGLVLVLAANLLGATFLGFLGGALLTEQRGSHDVIAGLTALIGVLGIYPTLIVAGPLVALVFPDG